ncbi:MAG: helix-turn-helix domain-containing protein [Acidimicrobiales bacterium]
MLLAAAARAFARGGFAATGLDDVAAEAGVSRVLTYRHFDSKEQLYTAAHRWLAKGGSESGLMAMAGWTRTDMLVRYTKARASERAAQEARRLNLGEL